MNNKKNNSITVFLYHEINNNPSDFCTDYDLCVSIEVFKKQIKWIDKNYNIISPEKLTNLKEDLPINSALITFDDGFLGAFNNGIKFLIENKIPSLMFLNMEHVINNTPLISAKAIFYQKICSDVYFNKNEKLHLTINPIRLKSIEKELSKNLDEEILNYQGKLADYQTVYKFSKSDFVFYGNHLYSHWNSTALNKFELNYNLEKNEYELGKLNNNCKYFAFPNGKFNHQIVDTLKNFNFNKVFSSSGRINFNLDNFTLDRINLTEFEYNSNKLYLRILKSKSKNFFISKFLGLLRKI